MKTIHYIYIKALLVLLFTTSLAAHAQRKEVPYARLEPLCEEARALSQYQQMEEYSALLLEGAQERNDQRAEAYAHFYNGLSKLFLGRAEAAIEQLDKAEDAAEAIGQDSVLALVMNTRAIYYATVKNNNFLAQEYFFKSLELARTAGHEDLLYRVRGNLLTLTHATGGSIPLERAREVYDYGVEHHNAEQLSMGAYYLAYYYYEHNDYAETEQYVNIALDAFKDFPTEDIASVYCLAAKMYLSTGKVERAEEMISKAVSLAEQYNQSSIVIDANITRAELLSHKKLYQESIDLILQTLEMIDDTGFSNKFVACNQLMAQNMLAIGNATEAIKYLQQANEVLKNQSTVNMERLHYEQKILRDMEQKDLEAKHRQEQLQQQRRTTIILIIAIVILIIFLLSLIAGYRHRHLLYRKIVEQNTRAIARQKVLEQQIASLTKESSQRNGKPGEQPALATGKEGEGTAHTTEKESFQMDEDRKQSIYTRLCYLMDSERLYAEPQLTREKMADRLGTNRTYLTNIIKEKAGMSYLQFVNSYRINEAIRILSDKECMDYPLKRIWSDLGFSSPTTFFKLFQQTVGITPTTYRKQFIEAAEEPHEPLPDEHEEDK